MPQAQQNKPNMTCVMFASRYSGIIGIMKLRISSNSLRLRLTRSEVEEFAANGSYECAIDLAGGRLTYRLERADVEATTARLSECTITVRVPSAAADRWTGSEDVGINALTAGSLKITIEKDFACLKPRAGEDTEDHYPHPEVGAMC
jgi:hypothetical protein